MEQQRLLLVDRREICYNRKEKRKCQKVRETSAEIRRKKQILETEDACGAPARLNREHAYERDTQADCQPECDGDEL